MSTSVKFLKKRIDAKIVRKMRRKRRIRGRITGTAARPRVSMFRSNRNMMAQAIDDTSGTTIACVSSYEKTHQVSNVTIEVAKKLGVDFAKRLKEKNIQAVVFDRNGYRYHGIIKAFADSMREVISL